MEVKLGWDILDDTIFRWLIWMSVTGLFPMMLEPAFTTMALARKPGLRSSKVPWGFDPMNVKTAEGSFCCCSMFTSSGTTVA